MGIWKTDRVAHEVTSNCEALDYFWRFDQFHLGTSGGIEKMCRHLVSAIEAHDSGAGSVSWQLSSCFEGTSGYLDGFAPGLRPFGGRKAQDEADLAAHRARGLGSSVSAADVDGAEVGAEIRGTGRARGGRGAGWGREGCGGQGRTAGGGHGPSDD